MSKKQNLSIYLLKKDISPQMALKEERESLKDYLKIPEAKYLPKAVGLHQPDWATYLDLGDEIKTSSASALLFIPRFDRCFVISFGYGYTLLNDNQLVDDFGLKTALNILDKDKIKGSGVFAPSDHSKQRKTQTATDSSLRGHDMDGYVHILKNITGKVKDKYKKLSQSVSANSQSIKITTDKAVDDLLSLCDELLDIYKKEDCKNDFPEAFYIQPVKKESILQNLDNSLVEAISKTQSDVYFEIPELIDFQDIDNYQINVKDRKRKKPEFDDIPTIEEFRRKILNDFQTTIETELLKHWDLDLIDQNGNKKQSFTLYKCLVFETVLGEQQYHFSHGKWYCVDSDFKQRLDKKLQSAKTEKINDKEIPVFSHSNEADYNEHLARELGAYLLDKKCISMGGYDKIEPCDVLYTSDQDKNTFIHVKIKHGGSSGLSHLFEQGDVSLTLLNNNDQRFVDGIKSRIPEFDQNKKTVVHFLIVSEQNRDIPLFARITLSKKIDQIISKRSKVCWSIIERNAKKEGKQS